jgi:hypothetical protein
MHLLKRAVSSKARREPGVVNRRILSQKIGKEINSSRIPAHGPPTKSNSIRPEFPFWEVGLEENFNGKGTYGFERLGLQQR